MLLPLPTVDWMLAIELGHPVPTFQNANFACNATMLGSAFSKTKVPGFISLQCACCWYGPGSSMDPNWKEQIAQQLGTALPHFRSGAVVGVFLGDEILCSKLPYSNYSAVLTPHCNS